MDGAAVEQVADQREPQAGKTAEFLTDRPQVGEGLRGVLADTIAGVDHGHGRGFGCGRGGALLEVADRDGVSVAGDDAHRVGDGFALAGGRAFAHVLGGDNAAAELLHGRLEAEARARGGLVEERGEDAAAERLRQCTEAVVALHGRGRGEERVQQLA